MSDNSENDGKLFTLTGEDGKARDVYPDDLNDKTQPIANELSAALEIKNARSVKYNEALLEIRTNQVIDAYISQQAHKLETALPPKVEVASGKVKK